MQLYKSHRLKGKNHILFSAIFFITGFITSFAQGNDDKIIITNKVVNYSYVKTKEEKIQLMVESATDFKCIKPDVAKIYEFYDNYSDIKSVKIKGLKGVAPKYGMYNKENIFFSGSKVCYIELPFTKKETSAQVLITNVYRDIRYLNKLILSEPYYIETLTIKINIPDFISVDILEQNFPDSQRKEVVRNDKEGVTTHIYTLEGQAAIISEDNSINYLQTYPHLLLIPRKAQIAGSQIDYFDTMDHLYKWYCEPLSFMQDDMVFIKSKADELTKGCTSDEDKIRSLCAWIQRSIRYIAFTNGIAAFKPDDAQEVFQKRYGDCKGMSNLLKALFVSLGFDARLAWVETNDNKTGLNDNIPLPFANHMICVLFWNGQTYYIDPTVKYFSLGETPEWIQGQKVMIEDGDKYILSYIPDYSPETNTDSLFISYRLDKGKLEGDGLWTLKGDSKYRFLHALNSITQQEHTNWLNIILQAGERRDSVTNIEMQNSEHILPEFSISYKEKRTSVIHSFGDAIYLNLDVKKDYQHLLIDTLNRKTDYRFPFREHIVRVAEVAIPEDYSLTWLPEDMELKREQYCFRISYKQEGQKIIYRKEITVHNPVIKKEDFTNWNADIKQLSSQYTKQITLKEIKK